MKVHFKLGDTLLKSDEAEALLSMSTSKPTIEVDISQYLTPSMVDAKKLFNKSIESSNPTLAWLAAKFATEAPVFKKKRAQKSRISRVETTESFESADEVIEKIVSSGSVKAVGACMILETLYKSDNRTLRQIATTSVNNLYMRNDVQGWFDCFKGFKKDHEGFFRAVTKSSSSSRAESYHSSPTYTSLREGAAMLTKFGLIEMQETVEYGSAEKSLEESAQRLRRVVYRCNLTELGRQVVDCWSDLQDFIVKGWEVRSNRHGNNKMRVL